MAKPLNEQNQWERAENESRAESQVAKASVQRAELIVKAAGTDAEVPVAVAASKGTVTSVTYAPSKQVSGGTSANKRTLSVINRGSANLGSAVVASFVVEAQVLTAFQPVNIPVTATNSVAAGDVLTFSSVHASSGVEDPGGELVVTISKTVHTQSLTGVTTAQAANEANGYIGTVAASQ